MPRLSSHEKVESRRYNRWLNTAQYHAHLTANSLDLSFDKNCHIINSERKCVRE